MDHVALVVAEVADGDTSDRHAIDPRHRDSNLDVDVGELVASLSDQENLTQVEFLLLDDNSEDETLALLHHHTSGLSNFYVLTGSALPQGWIGKTWALQQLFERANGEIIVSVD
ncbi:MAG: glycosyltransferase, partial [Actinobacteria bacterium]|nr:glycosyltransferase [Actinomycetota bacterium]